MGVGSDILGQIIEDQLFVIRLKLGHLLLFIHPIDYFRPTLACLALLNDKLEGMAWGAIGGHFLTAWCIRKTKILIIGLRRPARRRRAREGNGGQTDHGQYVD